MIEQRTRHDGIVQIIVFRCRHSQRLPPGRSAIRRQCTELGPREVRNETAATRIPPSLVDHRANRMREVPRLRSVHRDFRNGVLALERLTSSLEVDVLRQTLEIISAPLRACSLPLNTLDASGLELSSVPVGEADDTSQAK